MNEYRQALFILVRKVAKSLLRTKMWEINKKVPRKLAKAVQLLDKLVDKEDSLYVDYDYDGYADGCPVYNIAHCPECGRYFDLDCEKKCNYCPDCGQRLNWEFRELEDEEEE